MARYSKLLLFLLALNMSAMPALAQGISFSSVFDGVIRFLGPRGIDWLMAFGVVSVILFLAISNVPVFRENKAGLGLFALIGGLATAFYVYIQGIPFTQLIGPYFLLIVAITLGLMLLFIIRNAIARELSLTGTLGIIGLGALINGMLIASFSPPLAVLGGFIAVVGAILVIISGASWISGLKHLSLFRKSEETIGRDLRNIEFALADDVRHEQQFEKAQKTLIKDAQAALQNVARALKKNDLKRAQEWLQYLKGIVSKEYALTMNDIAVIKDLQKKCRELYDDIANLEKSEAKEEYDTKVDSLLESINQKLQNIVNWQQKMELFLTELEREGLNRIEKCISALDENNLDTASAEIPYLQGLLERLDRTVYSELNIDAQFRELLKKLSEIISSRKEEEVAKQWNEL